MRGHPGARTDAVSWTDDAGDLWLFGGYGLAASEGGYLNDLWKYDFSDTLDPQPQPGKTRLISAAYVDRNAISVTFNAPLADDSGVLEPTNYRISGPGAGTRVGAPAAPPTAPAPLAGGLTARWTDHTPTPANPATVERLNENTYRLTWTGGQFAAGQPMIIHVDDEHIFDLVGDLLGAPNFITLMIPFDAPGCICPTP